MVALSVRLNEKIFLASVLRYVPNLRTDRNTIAGVSPGSFQDLIFVLSLSPNCF